MRTNALYLFSERYHQLYLWIKNVARGCVAVIKRDAELCHNRYKNDLQGMSHIGVDLRM